MNKTYDSYFYDNEINYEPVKQRSATLKLMVQNCERKIFCFWLSLDKLVLKLFYL